MANGLKNLTDKEENFAQFYAVTGSPSGAYRHSYSTGNMKAKSVADNAQQVLKRPHVAYRIFELKQITTEEFRIDVRKKKMWLEKIINNATQLVNPKTGNLFSDDDEDENRLSVIADAKAAIAAINELNKMEGDHAAQKIKAKVDGTNLNLNKEIPDDMEAQEAAQHYMDIIKQTSKDGD